MDNISISNILLSFLEGDPISDLPCWGPNTKLISFLCNLFKSAELFLTCLKSRDDVREYSKPLC